MFIKPKMLANRLRKIDRFFFTVLAIGIAHCGCVTRYYQ